MKKIYLGMALRGTPTWWTDQFQMLVQKELRSLIGIEVTQFVGLKDVDATDIYKHDIEMAKSADLMVALTRFPSLGLGMEIQARIDLQKPTIVFHPAGQKLSGMVLGAPGVQVHYYDTAAEEDNLAQVDQIVTTLRSLI
jgi:hypothetical protein